VAHATFSAIQTSSVKAVLFDYGQVLTLTPDPQAWLMMQRTLGITASQLDVAYWAPRTDYDRGTLSGADYWHAAAKLCERVLSSADLAALIAADTSLWTRPNLPMMDWAQKLLVSDVPVGVLSNLGDQMMLGVLKAFPWLAQLPCVVWSHTLHMVKPEPEIYRYAAQQFNLPADTILFVDDRAENVAGAQAVGMRAIHYTDWSAFKEELKAYRIESMRSEPTE